MRIVTIEEMKRLERETDAAGFSYAAMMERAGAAVAVETCRRVKVAHRPVVVLVGPGNNGGDGLVAARYLHDAGARVSLILLRQRDDQDPNFRQCRERAIPYLCLEDDPGLRQSRAWLASADVVLDALLGTGAARPITGSMKELLALLADRQRDPLPFVVAVDLPSGLNADTGAVDPVTPYAHLTVTFACPKRGHFLSPGLSHVGELVVADIGIPVPEAGSPQFVTDQMVRRHLPARPAGAHKGTFGKALILAGSVNYPGAAALAAQSAYRVGAGLVTLACPAQIYPILASKLTEVTYLPLAEDAPGHLGPAGLPELLAALPNYDVLLIGPGLGQHPTTAALLAQLPPPSLPLVLDADALNLLSRSPGWWERWPAGVILTPHPGEMARLTGRSREEIETRRWEIAAESALKWQKVVLLKGACTVVTDLRGHQFILPFANPVLATAGSGDVLAGAIVGLLAQGLTPTEAALVGGYLHGLAGEIGRETVGEAGVTAGDLAGWLPVAIRRLGKRGEFGV